MTTDNGKRPTFAMYALTAPGGGTPTDLTRPLQKALDAFTQRHGQGPPAVVVSRGVEDRATQALGELGLGKLAVAGNGGCLAWEVWLEIPTGNGRDTQATAQSAVGRAETPPDGGGLYVARLEEIQAGAQPSGGLLARAGVAR